MNSKAKARKWRNTQRTMAFISGPRGGRPKPSQPSLLNTLPDVLQHCLQVERTAVAVPSSISNSQLRPPSLIADAPLKLWLKLLDFETLEVLHNKYVGLCAKNKLLGRRDETAYRTARLREAIHRELEYRRTKPPDGESPALGSQAQQSGTERLHRAVPKSRRQTRSQPVER